MTTLNARERFKNAVGILVDEPGDVRDRLKIAYISQLSRIDPQQELPETLAALLADVKVQLTLEEVYGDCGTVSKEVQKLTVDQASLIARRIFEIFLKLHDIKEPSHDPGTYAR